MKVKVFVFSMGLATFGVMGAAPALAQVTKEQARETARQAKFEQALYIWRNPTITGGFSNEMSSESLEIYRAVTNLQNMNAQQKLSCATHVLSFFAEATQGALIINSANTEYADGVSDYKLGVMALANGDFAVADEYFIDAKNGIGNARGNLNIATTNIENMSQSTAALRSIVDQVASPF